MRIKNNIGNTYWSIRSEWNMAKSTLTVKNTYSKGLNNLPGALKFEKMKNTKVLEMKNNSINIFLKCYCFFTFWSWIISFRQPSSLLLSSLLLSSLLLSSLLLSSLLLKRTETLRRRLFLHLEKFFFLSLSRQTKFKIFTMKENVLTTSWQDKKILKAFSLLARFTTAKRKPKNVYLGTIVIIVGRKQTEGSWTETPVYIWLMAYLWGYASNLFIEQLKLCDFILIIFKSHIHENNRLHGIKYAWFCFF